MSEPEAIIEHPPHVHRLLRLIREGTPSHASRASVLLGRYAASCSAGVIGAASAGDGNNGDSKSNDDGSGNTDGGKESTKSVNPGLIIWDLIGRLVGGDGNHVNTNASATTSRSRGKRKKNKGNDRPTSGLFDPNWSTRSNCAVALEYVARCLPLEDRRHFFEGGADDCDYGMTKEDDTVEKKPARGNHSSIAFKENATEKGDEEISLWLNVNDLCKTTTDFDEKSDLAIKHEHTKQEDAIQLNNAQKQNQLDIVVEQGRTLLSSSGEQYDWDCDDETKEYIRERDALQNLDATAAVDQKQPLDDSDTNLQQTFLMRRVKLQRQILARRLGLGGILSAPIVAGGDSQIPEESVSSFDVKRGRIIDNIVADEDLAPATSKKEKGKKRSKKRQRPCKSQSEQNLEQEKGPGISIRALLVLESKRSADDDGIDCKRARHRNPQTLLGSELAYRTFDPDWTVRHGALLGTLALLRAWKVHESPQITRNSSEHTKDTELQYRIGKKKFGRWPQDILARCICILALDQFADFSGTACSSGGSDNPEDGIASGAIVAPVREMAAQIIAILVEAAPPDVGACTHDLLMQLYTRQCSTLGEQGGNRGWEIRHGVLLAWKYNCVMALFHSQRIGKSPFQLETLNSTANGIRMLRPLSTLSMNQKDVACNSPLNNIILQSIRGLSDASDDNRAVAAQVLRHSILIDASLHTIDIVRECSKPLWEAIMAIRGGISSCAADLLHLLAEVLSRDCGSFISCLEGVQGSFSLDSILRKLTDFLQDDSIHVKISCLSALCLVAKPIATAILEGPNNNSHLQSVNNCASALCYVLNRLFGTHYLPEYIFGGDILSYNQEESNNDSAQELSNNRNQAWGKTLGALSLLVQPLAVDGKSPQLAMIDDTFTTLALRYFGISRVSMPSTNDNLYKFTRITDTVGIEASATETTFHATLTSARALSQFYMDIYSKDQPSILSDAIGAVLQSPWLRQCEAGCLLHICMASSAKLDSSSDDSHPFFEDYLPILMTAFEVTPTSILLEEHSSSMAIQNDSKVLSICDNGLAMLLDSSKKCASKEIVQMWESVFIQHGVPLQDLRKSPRKSLTKASMRLTATLSGSLVSCGSKYLPPKVTPLIRALMTSLKNEESQSRRFEICHYISKLVASLSVNPTHEKARNKLLENVCALACNRGAESYGPSKGAEHVIKLLVAGLNTKLEDFPSIWERLLPLLNEFSPDTACHGLSDSIYMLGIVSGSISKENPSFEPVLNSFATPAVGIACKSESEPIRTLACTTIQNFCRFDFNSSMDIIVPSLLPCLSNLQDDQGREGGCILLLSILRDFEVMMARYVTSLLPVAMRLMTDPFEECSRLAASAFAILVRIAPLAASALDKGTGETTTQDASNDVIRHLILGKPLPPCALPVAIVSELQKSGTTLRPYQIEGISWLNFLTDVHLNGALCDDMGLGKTLQALVAVAISHNDQSGMSNEFAASNPCSNKKSLVVCPSSVVGHWVSEIKRFFPSNIIFAPFDFTGNAKNRRSAWHKNLQESNIVVTSYSVLRNDINLLEDVLWEWIILDEGHLLKNPKTSTAKSSRRLKACHKLILTGTPIQNNVHEIWATFDFLMPNFLGTESSFLKEFAKPILKSQASDASAAHIHQGMESLKILHQQVLPFVLRREKSQVIKELPPKIITDVPCILSKQQYALYQQTLKQSGMKEALEMVDSSLASTDGQSSDAAGPQQLGGDVLTSLLQLRLICTHPLLHSLFSSKNRDSSHKNPTSNVSLTRLDCSGKLSTLNDLLRHAGIAEAEMTAADNDESGFLLDANESIISDESSDIDGIVDRSIEAFDDSQADDSPELSTNSSKCLIFAQFTQSLDIVERLLFGPHMPSLQYLRLDGRIPSNQRNSVVNQFNQDPHIKVLLLTTKVGGLGLNLTGADKVIFLEPDWNPFVDLQAMDRAHRIGQTKTVNVYRLITSDTIEEKMMKLQQRKKATSEAVVNSENSTMFSMGTDRLLDIFTCRGDSSTAAASQHNEAGADNLLSYLDNGKDEYSSLSVDNFMRGLA